MHFVLISKIFATVDTSCLRPYKLSPRRADFVSVLYVNWVCSFPPTIAPRQTGFHENLQRGISGGPNIDDIIAACMVLELHLTACCVRCDAALCRTTSAINAVNL